MKTHDQNDLKLGTVAVLDSVSMPTAFGFKRSRVRVRVRESALICIFRVQVLCGGNRDHAHNHNNRNHELCSAPFTIRSIDQRCITVKVLSLHTQHRCPL